MNEPSDAARDEQAPRIPAAHMPRHVRPTRLVLLGHPVAHSLSPRFQQAALDAAGLPVRYTARDTAPDAWSSTLAELAAARAGGNVTVPHKEAAYRACATTTELAERVGAVNTFAHDADGRLIGHNTDVAGARAAILAIRTGAHASSRVVLLGAGGSAASVLAALTELGAASVTIAARQPERATRLGARMGLTIDVIAHDAEQPSDALRAAIARADLVINTTPLGLHGDAMPLPPATLSPESSVLDLVYRPGETPWVRACRARGCRAEDGLRMLVEQGAEAFAWWFGVPPDRAVMWRALDREPAIVTSDT